MGEPPSGEKWSTEENELDDLGPQNGNLQPWLAPKFRLHDSYLDELLPLFVRHAALRAQPGDVLKLQSERGMVDDEGDG